MKFLAYFFVLSFFIINIQSASAADFAATAVLVRGSAKLQIGDRVQELKLQDRIPEGTVISTEARSFVKILFKDNSQMNIGPESKMKIEAMHAGEAGVVSIISGQIRSKVTKDLLNQGSEDKSKLFIKTKTAAMGIRGTDFQVIYNTSNNVTSLVTFEGSVAMTKMEASNFNTRDTSRLENMLHSGETVMVGAGQYSGSNPNMPKASLPVKISPAQLETMKGSDSLSSRTSSNSTQTGNSSASPIPPGVDPKAFSSSDKNLENKSTNTRNANSPPPEGMYDAKTGNYAPRAGGFIDTKTGIYVPPPPGSAFDANTGVFVPPKVMGGFDPNTGNYVPPKGLELDAQKGFIAAPTAAGTSAANTPATALLNQMNTSMQASSAGTSVTFQAMAQAGPTMAPPPPPPPGAAPPPAAMTQPKDPSVDPYCPTCHQDNINTTQPPQNSTVKFNINVI